MTFNLCFVAKCRVIARSELAKALHLPNLEKCGLIGFSAIGKPHHPKKGNIPNKDLPLCTILSK